MWRLFCHCSFLISPFCGALDPFLCNNSSLVNRVEVIPGICDNEAVYIVSSLRPSKPVTLPREVHLYHKADIESLKGKLIRIKEDFISMEPTSTTKDLWNKVSGLMKIYIPSKMLKGKETKSKSLGQLNYLFRKMKKIRCENDLMKYKENKKTESQSYWNYTNNIVKTDDLWHELHQSRRGFGTTLNPCVRTVLASHH